jgi:hypothetical protein
MKTQEQELQAIERKMQNEREAIAAKYKVLDAIGDLAGYAPPSVHYYKLYGSRGSVNFGIQRYASIAEGKSPDRALLARLIEQFPPVARVQVKDGCTSFRPNVSAEGFNVASLKGEADYRGELLDVCPITVRIEVFQGPTVKFEWYSPVSGELWEFHVEYHLYQTDLGNLRVKYDYYDRWQNKIKQVSVCEFTPKHGAQRIRWASGSPETPNSFTLWWDVDSGKAVNFPELVNLPKEETK